VYLTYSNDICHFYMLGHESTFDRPNSYPTQVKAQEHLRPRTFETRSQIRDGRIRDQNSNLKPVGSRPPSPRPPNSRHFNLRPCNLGIEDSNSIIIQNGTQSNLNHLNSNGHLQETRIDTISASIQNTNAITIKSYLNPSRS
jgi:hypothetical protein